MSSTSHNNSKWKVSTNLNNVDIQANIHPAALVEIEYLIGVEKRNKSDELVSLYDVTSSNVTRMNPSYISDIYNTEKVEYVRHYEGPLDAEVQFLLTADNTDKIIDVSDSTNIHIEHLEYTAEIESPIIKNDDNWNVRKNTSQTGNKVRVSTVLTREGTTPEFVDSGYVKFVGPDTYIKHKIRFKLDNEIIAEDYIDIKDEIDLSAFNDEWLEGKELDMEIFCKLQTYNVTSKKYTDHEDDTEVILLRSTIVPRYHTDPTLIISEEVGTKSVECSNVLGTIQAPPSSDDSVGADISRQLVEAFERTQDIVNAPYCCSLKMNSMELPDQMELYYFVNLENTCCSAGKVLIHTCSVITHNSNKVPVHSDITVKTRVCDVNKAKPEQRVTRKVHKETIDEPANAEGCGCGKKKPPQLKKKNKK